MAEIGIAITAEEIANRYVGGAAASMLAALERRYDHFETEPMTIDGIDAVLAAQQGKRCVASSSMPDRVRRCLTLLGLLHCFEPHIFSASLVARGKPAPDLFLFAAREMGEAPEDCLVIEDSVHGVTAAVAAGMRVYGFTGASHCRPGHAKRLLAAGTSTTFQHMRELPGLL